MRVKQTSAAINSSKDRIDVLLDEIGQRKAIRIETLQKSGLKSSETEDIVDAEEFELMKELKTVKREYKENYQRLQTEKNELRQVSMTAEAARTELADRFSHSQAMQTGMMDGRGGDPDDQLDDQEAFDRLEVQRVMNDDPDSLAFFHAQKTRRANKTQNATNISQIKKNKRFS